MENTNTTIKELNLRSMMENTNTTIKELKMSNFTFEYNEYVQGFVVSCGNEEAYLQFCSINNEMIFGSDGGYISDGFTDEMIDEAYNAAEKNKEVMHIEKMFRDIYADDKKLEVFNELRARQGYIYIHQIEEIVDGELVSIE